MRKDIKSRNDAEVHSDKDCDSSEKKATKKLPTVFGSKKSINLRI